MRPTVGKVDYTYLCQGVGLASPGWVATIWRLTSAKSGVVIQADAQYLPSVENCFGCRQITKSKISLVLLKNYRKYTT
jgi:hypothetical protein